MGEVPANESNASLEPKWGKMLVVSLVFHLVVFSTVFLFPQTSPSGRFPGTVYEVNLVEMPRGGPAQPQKGGAAPVAKKTSTPTPKDTKPAKRIPTPKREEKPVVIAKRTEKAPEKKSEPSPSKLIDEAVSKIQKKVEAEQKDHLSQRLAELEQQVGKPKGEEVAGGSAAGARGGSILDDIYRMQVSEWIRSNWSYPVALGEERRQKDLEAVVVVKVNQGGKILHSWFVKRSGNGIFDQSVEKAVERSDPVPPFPEGYSRNSTEELEVTFNLSELEEQYR